MSVKLDVFLDQEVSIVEDIIYTLGKGVSMPLTSSGFLIDYDDEFVYLSKTGTGIDKAVAIAKIIEIELLPEKEEDLGIPELGMKSDLKEDKYDMMIDDYDEVDPKKMN